MEDKNRRGVTPEPAEGSEGARAPERAQKPVPGEGSYRNVETAVNRPEDFDEDYAEAQEAEMANEQARTEDENNT